MTRAETKRIERIEWNKDSTMPLQRVRKKRSAEEIDGTSTQLNDLSGMSANTSSIENNLL